jgi:hypothetical protein
MAKVATTVVKATVAATATTRLILAIVCSWMILCVLGEDRLGLPNEGDGDTTTDETVGDGVTDFKDVMDNCTVRSWDLV